MRSILLTAGVISAVPIAALLVLVLASAAAAVPALLAMAVVAASGLALAMLSARQLRRAVASLRRAARDGSPESARLGRTGAPLGADLAAEAQLLLVDLASRKEAAEVLWRADEAIIEALAAPLLTLGTDLRLRRANRSATREFGPEAAAILRHPAVRAAVNRAIGTGDPQAVDLTLPVPRPRELRAAITPLNAEVGHERVVILLADHTRERAIDRTRADFVANAGHELRTPLASLIGFIETLQGPAADDRAAQQRFLGIMAEQAARMERLIADLLDLSRIELAEHRTPDAQIDLVELSRKAAAGFEPAILARMARLELAVGPAPLPVIGDADQLAQVLQNVIGNALQHGGTGVHIRLAVEPAGPGERWPARAGVVLSVADDGPGIAPEHLPRITERFYRVDAARSRAVGGTGLGLAIVKHIVTRHRGQLQIESTQSRGTTLRIWLPAAPGAVERGHLDAHHAVYKGKIERG